MPISIPGYSLLTLRLTVSFSKLTVIAALLIMISGCASLQLSSELIATVDGEPILKKDIEYAMKIAHRREILSSAEPVNIRDFIDKIIDEKLMVQEARRAGLDNDPEIDAKVKAYILRESVTRLYREEVLDKAAGKKDRKALARKYLESLLAKNDPYINRSVVGAIPDNMKPAQRDALSHDERVAARVGDFELTVGQLARMMPQRMMNRAPVDIVQGWIDRKVVDIEALSRKYDLTTDLRDAVSNYRDQLVLRKFSQLFIRPQISLSKEDLKKYFDAHKQDFMRPKSYKIQQITVGSAETAANVHDSLVGGADFAWIARQFSKDMYASHGGIAGWFSRDQLDRGLRDRIESMEPGDLSPVIGNSSRFIIVRLIDKKEGRPGRFNSVRELVVKRLYREKYAEVYRNYSERLRKDAAILLYEENIRPLEEAFRSPQKNKGGEPDE